MYWNELWKQAETESNPSKFVKKIQFIPLSDKSIILELGCGLGKDTIEFLKLGFKVIAVDFSINALNITKKALIEYFNNGKLSLLHQDLNYEFPSFSENSIDLVYSHLGLHYFTEARTQKIFTEIHKVLKPQSKLAFAVKTISDPLYGKGNLIETNMFDYKGHIRHFYSKKQLVSYLDNFKILLIEEIREETTFGHRTVFHCLAQRKHN